MVLLFNLFPFLSGMKEPFFLGGRKMAENVPKGKVYNHLGKVGRDRSQLLC